MTSVLISPRHHEFAAACEQSGRRVFTWPELDVAELNNNFSLDESIDHLFESSWRIDNGRFHLDVTTPPNTTATVRLPNGRVHEVGAGKHHFSA